MTTLAAFAQADAAALVAMHRRLATVCADPQVLAATIKGGGDLRSWQPRRE